MPYVMLAKVFQLKDESKVKKWWQSEKLDGVRGTISSSGFMSRTGKHFTVPLEYHTFAKQLPKGVVVDGEWYGGIGSFHNVSGTLRRKHIIEKEWHSIHFHAFDIFSPTLKNEPYSVRYELLQKTVKELGVLRVVKQYKHMNNKLYEKWIRKGGEGAMLRNPNATYQFKRSNELLKWKPYLDTEATILGFVEGKGKYKGKLGAFIVKDGSKTFQCAGRLSDDFRSHYHFKDSKLVNHLHNDGVHPRVGDIITYSYMEKIDGMPRQPIFIRLSPVPYS